MSSRFGVAAAVQPPSSTNPRGTVAMGPRNTQKESSAVITLDELDRIRRQVIQTKADSYETIRNNNRQALQETSKNRVKNWSNTMDAQRIQREENRIKRLEEAEVSISFIVDLCTIIREYIDGCSAKTYDSRHSFPKF